VKFLIVDDGDVKSTPFDTFVVFLAVMGGEDGLNAGFYGWISPFS